jgi:hypothetical protein
MIEYINKRMIEWATWSKCRDDGGLGYTGVASYCRLAAVHSTPRSGDGAMDEPSMEIERIVQAMKLDRPKQYDVAYWVYLAGSLTMERVAKELQCSRDTVYTRLHALHLHVMNAMFDNTIEAMDRADHEKSLAKLRHFS